MPRPLYTLFAMFYVVASVSLFVFVFFFFFLFLIAGSRETSSQRNNENRNAPITADHRDSYGDAQPVDLIAWWRLAVSSRNVTIYNSEVTTSWDKRYTLNYLTAFTTMNNNHLFYNIIIWDITWQPILPRFYPVRKLWCILSANFTLPLIVGSIFSYYKWWQWAFLVFTGETGTVQAALDNWEL